MASVSPGCQKCILSPRPGPTESESLGVGASGLKFENHCSMIHFMRLRTLLPFPQQLRLVTALFTFCPIVYLLCPLACPLLPPELDGLLENPHPYLVCSLCHTEHSLVPRKFPVSVGWTLDSGFSSHPGKGMGYSCLFSFLGLWPSNFTLYAFPRAAGLMQAKSLGSDKENLLSPKLRSCFHQALIPGLT